MAATIATETLPKGRTYDKCQPGPDMENIETPVPELPEVLIMRILCWSEGKELYPSLGHTHISKATQMAHWAVTDIAKLLLSRYTVQGALNRAVKHGKEAVCRYLLQNAEPRAKADHSYSTSLWTAAKQGHLSICRLLLSQHDNPSRADDFGSTALQAAAEAGFYDICKLLLEWPTNPAKASDGNSGALRLACTGGHYDIAQMLLTQPRHPALACDSENAALVAAAATGDIKLCRLLVSQRFNTAQSTQPALFAAAQGGYLDICKLLLENFPSPAHAARGRGLVLWQAARWQLLTVCQLMLEQLNSPPYSEDILAEVLTECAMQKDVDLCRLLLKHGAKADCSDSFPLQASVRSPAVFELLLNAQVSIPRTEHYCRALRAVAFKGHGPEAVAVVVQRMPPIDDVMACMQGINWDAFERGLRAAYYRPPAGSEMSPYEKEKAAEKAAAAAPSGSDLVVKTVPYQTRTATHHYGVGAGMLRPATSFATRRELPEHQRTALSCAAAAGHRSVVQLLLNVRKYSDDQLQAAADTAGYSSRRSPWVDCLVDDDVRVPCDSTSSLAWHMHDQEDEE